MATKKHKRNNNHKWHRHQRGGKSFAERRGRELKIQELETEIAQAEKEVTEYEGVIEKLQKYLQFTPFWYGTPQAKARAKRVKLAVLER